mgnify:FL=1
MNNDVRFVSPVFDDNSEELLFSSFKDKSKKVMNILKDSPYEITILAYFIKKIETTIKSKER